jgi:hypothetical protein
MHIEADPDAPDDKITKSAHVLWAPMLLKIYSTEAVLSGLCGMDKDTFHKWAWYMIKKKVSYLEHEVVSFFLSHGLKHTSGAPLTLVSSIFVRSFVRITRKMMWGMSVCFMLKQLQDARQSRGNAGAPKAFFSFKFKNSGLCYDLGNNIGTGDIC